MGLLCFTERSVTLGVAFKKNRDIVGVVLWPRAFFPLILISWAKLRIYRGCSQRMADAWLVILTGVAHVSPDARERWNNALHLPPQDSNL